VKPQLHDNLDRLIAYAEGQLPLDDRAAFERELAESPELRAQFDLMRQIDRSLMSQFSPPADLEAQPSPSLAPSTGLVMNPWRRWAGIVGAAVAASILIALAWSFVAGPPRPQRLTLASLYESHVAGGFKPDWVCKDDREFIDTTRQAFGVPLLARTEGEVEIIGWAGYGDRLTDLGLSGSAKEILARVNGEEVLVLIDSPPPAKPPRDGSRKLNVFERRIGDVALYEVTPLDKPVAIERFVLRQ
jgi:hypothetical protein